MNDNVGFIDFDNPNQLISDMLLFYFDEISSRHGRASVSNCYVPMLRLGNMERG